MAVADDAVREELAQVAASLRELLLWEQEIGGPGLSEQALEARTPREPQAPEPQAPEPEAPEAEAVEGIPQGDAPSADALSSPGASSATDAAPPSAEQAALFQEPAPPKPGLGPRRPSRPAGGPPQTESQLPKLDPEERHRRLTTLAEQAATCTKCNLHQGRTQSVFARGSPDTELVFIGEAPGYYEDQQGLPFVGRAGKLLDRMIQAMGYGPDDVYICNVIKCRPPDNRTPLPDEAAACLPYLEGQLEAIGPHVMIALGRTAAEHLGCIPEGARGWRGKWRTWRGVPVMPTYHPAFLLRSPQFKRQVWEDLQQVMKYLGKEPPKK